MKQVAGAGQNRHCFDARHGVRDDTTAANDLLRPEDLETILDRFLTYGQTATSFVVPTPVPPRTLPITG